MIHFNKYCILFFFLIFSSLGFSQDQVILKDHSVIECKIININSNYLNIKVDNLKYENIPIVRIADFNVDERNSKFHLLDDSLAQQKEIRFQRKGFSTKIYLDEKMLNSSEAKSLLYKNGYAFDAYKNGKGIQITGTVIASLGGVAFIGSFFTFLAPDGGDIVPIAISAGTAIIGVTIFYAGANKQKRAIDQYNSKLKNKVSDIGFKFGTNQYGIGIAYQF